MYYKIFAIIFCFLSSALISYKIPFLFSFRDVLVLYIIVNILFISIFLLPFINDKKYRNRKYISYCIISDMGFLIGLVFFHTLTFNEIDNVKPESIEPESVKTIMVHTMPKNTFHLIS